MLTHPVQRRLFNRVLRPLAMISLCGVLLFSQQMARADIWGYIDDKGVAHFAAERLDERYELFSRSGQSLQAGQAEGVKVNALRPVAVPTVPPKLIAFFEVSPSYKQVKHLLRQAAYENRIDYELLQAVIATESGFDAAAVSPKGAVGLMQIMPATAQRYGVAGDPRMSVERKLADPRTNIRVGARYLRYLMALFPGQLELALAAYNAGEGAVLRAGSRVPNYRETQSYVRTVLQLYAVLKPPTLHPMPGRVRMELAGGAAGRSNMLASVHPSAVQIPSLTETD